MCIRDSHKEWDRSGASKASVIISIEEVDGINDKLKEIIYQTQDVYKRQTEYYKNNTVSKQNSTEKTKDAQANAAKIKSSEYKLSSKAQKY